MEEEEHNRLTSCGEQPVRQLTESVKKLTVGDTMEYPRDNILDRGIQLRQEILKKDVLKLLRQHGPQGFSKQGLWDKVKKETRRPELSAKMFGVIKLKDLAELRWKDEIETYCPNPEAPNVQFYRIRQVPLKETEPTIQAKTETLKSSDSANESSDSRAATGGSVSKPSRDHVDESLGAKSKTFEINLTEDQLSYIARKVQSHLSGAGTSGMKLRKFTKHLRTYLKEFGDIHGFREGSALSFLHENFPDLVSVEANHKHVENFGVHLKRHSSPIVVRDSHEEDLIRDESHSTDSQVVQSRSSRSSSTESRLIAKKHTWTDIAKQAEQPLQSEIKSVTKGPAKTENEVPMKSAQKEKPKSAMELMSSLSGWGKPATTPASDVKQNKKKRTPVLKIGNELHDVISVPDDDDDEDIQLVEMDEANTDKDVEIVKEEKPQKTGLMPTPVQLMPMQLNQFQTNFCRPPLSLNPQFLFNMQAAIRQPMTPQPLISPPVRGGSILPGPLPSFLTNPITYQQILRPQSLHSPSGAQSPQLTATKLPNMGRPVQLDDDEEEEEISDYQKRPSPEDIAGPRYGSRSMREGGPHVHSYLMIPEPSHAHIRADTIDLTIKPVDTQMFEQKIINVSPIFVPRGQMVTKEFVDNVAKECMEALAEANESVTPDRVEKLICQRFNIPHIRVLNIGYVDQLNSVHELNRMICKVNTYILGFVKVRCICTLYELEQALREYETNKQDFKELKLGPLQRLPVVYQQFRFPPDMMHVPEITSMDILDHFHNYLTRRNLWSAKLELEPFMEYLVETYEAENAYQLGVRVRSLPLMAGILKKAQRDCGNNRREILEHLKDTLRSDIGDAFRKFRASLLQGTGEGMEVRTHYMKVRPEIVIQEVMEKFNLLLLTTKMGLKTTGRITKVKKVVEDFLTTVRTDMFLRDILHLTICMSNTALEQTTLALLTPPPAQQRGDEGVAMETKPPPKKDALTEALKKYIERCLNAGALSLVHLDRIEEKLLEDFAVASFPQMGYGRFLEFLLAEAKQMLEESGGLVMGSGGSGATEGDTTSFKPHQADLMEFIRQCQHSGIVQPAEIEDALCRQFGVRDVRNLGHGNITRLLSLKEKHGGRYSYGDVTVVYECTLAPSAGLSMTVSSKVGILGHQTRDAAKICLHTCPLLEDMAAWSQWGLVFEPELGKLKDFVQKYGGVSTKTVEGGQLATLDFLALETDPGHLLKIVSTTSPDHFTRALGLLDPVATSGHLVSMAVAYKGVSNMPLALLTGHMKTVLLQVYANEGTGRDSSGDSYPANAAARFVLQCLLKCPLKMAVALANQLFLEPLGQVMGATSSKQLLPSLCASVEEQNTLTQLGCLLGVQEWTRLIGLKCVLPESAMQNMSREMGDMYTEEPEQDEDEEEEVVSDTEDVDEILAGDLEVKKSDGETVGSSDTVAIGTETTDESVILVDGDVEMASVTTETPTAATPTCEDIVNEIRRDEFGIGVHLSEDGQRLMKVQQDRLGRSLDRLSKDLYSKDTHFVLELIQNADDNNYAEELYTNQVDCPSVKFVIDEEGIRVYNNESGFREKDIRALCDVGRSTKGKHKFGYIGQKGIGFKSVFRVTDCPEVHSNGFHIRFDVNSGSMGYILPHWVPASEHPQQQGWMTYISLTLKTSMRLQTRTLAARFNDIHPSLLLFLHRLREITIENKIENGVQKFRRRDVGNNIVEIEHTHGTERWLVVKKMLDATKISLQAKSGAEVESTEVALAFPLRPAGLKSGAKVLPPKQPVFAFLPLRSYGFRFIVQGDFDVPSSREDVDRDSPWNQWLRSEIHTIFIDALEAFKTQNADSPLEAVCMFLQFVPMEDEVLDFFKPVSSDILKKLKARPCVPTQPDEQGVVSWKLPSQTVQVRDPLVRTVVTPSLLATHLNLFYLNHEVAAMLNPALTACLGIETLTSEHLFQLGKALVVHMENKCSSEEDVLLIARWLACMYRSLDEFHEDQSILEKLKSHRILPLTDGELVSLNEKTVFCPVPQSGGKREKKAK
ncbi:hypothetical protein DPMN_040549, partial [Dreissena polymorpha]